MHPLILRAHELLQQSDSDLPPYDLAFIQQVVSQCGPGGRSTIVAWYQDVRDAARNPAPYLSMQKQMEGLIRQLTQDSAALKNKIDEAAPYVARVIGKNPWTAFMRGKVVVLMGVGLGLTLASWRTIAGLVYHGGIASSELDAAAMSLVAVGSSFTLKPIEDSLPTDQKKRQFRLRVGVASVAMVICWTGLMSAQWGELWSSQGMDVVVGSLFSEEAKAATRGVGILASALLGASVLLEFCTSGSLMMLLESVFRQQNQYAASTSPECKFYLAQRDEVENDLAATIGVHCDLERRCEELRRKDSTYAEGAGCVFDSILHERQSFISKQLEQYDAAQSLIARAKRTPPGTNGQASSNGRDH